MYYGGCGYPGPVPYGCGGYGGGAGFIGIIFIIIVLFILFWIFFGDRDDHHHRVHTNF